VRLATVAQCSVFHHGFRPFFGVGGIAFLGETRANRAPAAHIFSPFFWKLGGGKRQDAISDPRRSKAGVTGNRGAAGR
jgi:hypothetical protein